jgi:hypothetical protein
MIPGMPADRWLYPWPIQIVIPTTTTEQNIAFIADSVIITLQIQTHESLKPYKNILVTWTSKYQSSTQITQRKYKQWAIIFSKCHRQSCWNAGSRIPPLTLHPNNLHVWICSPKGVCTTTYWQMTHLWWMLWKNYTTWHMAGGSHRLVCIKPILSYNSLQNFLPKFYSLRVEITLKYYIVASYVALDATQQS